MTAATISIPVSPVDALDLGRPLAMLTSLTYNDVVLHVQQPPGTDVLTDNLGTIDP